MITLSRITGTIFCCCCIAAICGCTKKEGAAGDTTAVASSTESEMAVHRPVDLADVAGKWNMRAVPTSGPDTSATTYVMNATNSTSGWTLNLPGRPAMPLQISIDGDSIMISAAPYTSVRRKGVRVSTTGALRLKNGDLVGVTTAHYSVKTPDSVLTLTTTGTRTR